MSEVKDIATQINSFLYRRVWWWEVRGKLWVMNDEWWVMREGAMGRKSEEAKRWEVRNERWERKSQFANRESYIGNQWTVSVVRSFCGTNHAQVSLLGERVWEMRGVRGERWVCPPPWSPAGGGKAVWRGMAVVPECLTGNECIKILV